MAVTARTSPDSSSTNARRSAGGREREKAVPDCGEEARRQHAVRYARRVLPRQPPEIRSRPEKIIPFRNDNPRSRAVEAQALLHRRRNFDRETCVFRQSMGYRQHEHSKRLRALGPDGGDDRARPIFGPLLAAFEMFAMPKVSISHDQTRDGPRKRHPASLQFVIEVRKFIRHFRAPHRFEPFFREFGG